MARRTHIYLALFLAMGMNSCVFHRFEVIPVEVNRDTPISVASPVKVHLRDGSTVVFPDGLSVSDGIVRGSGQRYDLTLRDETSVSEIALADVAAMESYQTPVNITAGNPDGYPDPG